MADILIYSFVCIQITVALVSEAYLNTNNRILDNIKMSAIFA